MENRELIDLIEILESQVMSQWEAMFVRSIRKINYNLSKKQYLILEELYKKYVEG